MLALALTVVSQFAPFNQQAGQTPLQRQRSDTAIRSLRQQALYGRTPLVIDTVIPNPAPAGAKITLRLSRDVLDSVGTVRFGNSVERGELVTPRTIYVAVPTELKPGERPPLVVYEQGRASRPYLNFVIITDPQVASAGREARSEKPVVSLTRIEALTWSLTLFGLGPGLFWLRGYLRARRLKREIERVASVSIRNADYGKPPPAGASADEASMLATDADWKLGTGPIVLESIAIENFKNIEQLSIDFTKESKLIGNWTCIAGINGAGKTSILQAICLILLGSDLVTELGRVRLGRMARRTPSGTMAAEIRAVIRQGSHRRRLYLPLTAEGVDEEILRRQPDLESMRLTWKTLREHVLVSYGVSRNVSEYKDPRHISLSPAVRRQMTLFDPLSQIASVEVLLEGGEKDRAVLEMLYRLLAVVLESESFSPKRMQRGDKLRFSLNGTSVDVIDLPDGFRSTVAWLADLCDAWHSTPSGRQQTTPDPTAMSGIVLLDEIGLHLHASLERAVIPQLRRALPNVQFVVTTHSPMVLSSFDRAELVMLDASSATGTKELDRQVFGLSMDDIYNWLMDTKSSSKVMEELLAEGADPDLAAYMYQSKDINEEKAREILEEREKLVKDLKDQAGQV